MAAAAGADGSSSSSSSSSSSIYSAISDSSKPTARSKERNARRKMIRAEDAAADRIRIPRRARPPSSQQPAGHRANI
jgi:hypothetical protein